MGWNKGKNMSVVAASAENWDEGDEPNSLAASIRQVVEARFGPSSDIRDVGYITDPHQLRALLEIAVAATSLTDIESAIRSAVPPPE